MFRAWPFGGSCMNSYFTVTIYECSISCLLIFQRERELLSGFCSAKCWTFLCFISALYRWGTFRCRRPHQQLTINVWAGTVGDCLVGPHVLSHRLTGSHYRDFLLHDLPKLLEDVPLAVRARMWYMRDGASAHFSRAVRDVPSNTYHNRWIGREGLTACPPRSPDFNPLHIYLWRHLKALVYAAPVDNQDALHHRNVDACQTIRNYPGISERMWRSVNRRVEECTESHEGHFQHLQMYPFSCNSQIKYFRTHLHTNMFSCFGMWNSCQSLSATFGYILYIYSIYTFTFFA
jgi:hypothetical protein